MYNIEEQKRIETIEFLVSIIEELMVRRKGITTLQEIKTIKEALEIAQRTMHEMVRAELDNAS